MLFWIWHKCTVKDGSLVKCMTNSSSPGLTWASALRYDKNDATDLTDDKKDVDTGTNLVCEDSRLNIRNGTPSQLIFHSHESDNREIETNIPVDNNWFTKPAFFKLSLRPFDDIKVLVTFSSGNVNRGWKWFTFRDCEMCSLWVNYAHFCLIQC